MDFHAAAAGGATVVQTISAALGTLKNARELAKESKDHDLKNVISEALDALLDLKERMMALDEENRELKARFARKEAVRGPVKPHSYFYKEGDTEHPLCPQCYQKDNRVYYLSPVEDWNGGKRRHCETCGWMHYEVPMQLASGARLTPKLRR